MKDPSKRSPKQITAAHYASFLTGALGVPVLCAFSLFSPSKPGPGIVTTSLSIALYFLLYASAGTVVFRIQRASAAQFVVFVALSLSILSSELLSFASLFRQLGILDGDGNAITDPLTCLYLSVVTWTTVGYGDFVPSPQARGFAAGEALLGYIFMAVLIAALLHLMQRFYSERSDNVK